MTLSNSMTVLSTSVYIQWDPVQKDALEFPFHKYYIYIRTDMNIDVGLHNYSTDNTWFNITGLDPHTSYFIAVSYSVNNTEGNLILSGLSDIVNVTTQCELDYVWQSPTPPPTLSLTHHTYYTHTRTLHTHTHTLHAHTHTTRTSCTLVL